MTTSTSPSSSSSSSVGVSAGEEGCAGRTERLSSRGCDRFDVLQTWVRRLFSEGRGCYRREGGCHRHHRRYHHRHCRRRRQYRRRHCRLLLVVGLRVLQHLRRWFRSLPLPAVDLFQGGRPPRLRVFYIVVVVFFIVTRRRRALKHRAFVYRRLFRWRACPTWR